MASLDQNPKNGRYYVRFRFAGKSFKRSLKTTSQEVADAAKARLEETLKLVQRGRVLIPDDADPVIFLLTDGKKNEQAKPEDVQTLGELFDAYLASLPPGSKEESTLEGEAIHRKHLLRILKKRCPLKSLNQKLLQNYINQRLTETYRKQLIRPATIRKELTTLRLMWNWGKDEGMVSTNLPTRRLNYPKLDEKPPFMTWAEIEQTIALHQLDEEAAKELWESLFLTRDETEEFLDHAQDHNLSPHIYPLLVATAHLGWRRSEMMRSQINDFDFARGIVRIREKKKSRKFSISFRAVPMSARLREAMTHWLAQHPRGTTFTFCSMFSQSLTRDAAHNCFKSSIRGSRWQHIRGFHVLRHSFASNLAAAGIDERVIDEWMGHQTEEMRKRYRHLFPQQARNAIDAVFGDSSERATIKFGR